jgi:hypothetical protein
MDMSSASYHKYTFCLYLSLSFILIPCNKGWFIGETLFLDNKTHDVIEASLIAKGPVTLCEVNLSFVKKLFEVDRVSYFFSFADPLLSYSSIF